MPALASLCVTVALALLASSSSLVIRKAPITIPIARHFNASKPKGVLELDQLRARSFKQKINALTRKDDTTPIANGAVAYTADVQVGNPPQNFSLLVDTGSSNTWVGVNSGDPYLPNNSDSAIPTGKLVAAAYGSGFIFGTLYTDTITIGDLQITNQTIGKAQISLDVNGFDGILGLGPTDLTNTTTEDGSTIPTITDTAFASHKIDAKQVGILFAPATNDSIPNGNLTLGGFDTSQLNGTINLVEITSTSPSNEYVGINQTITYGTANTSILTNTAGIVDTGTTMLLLASDAFAEYQTATNAVMDNLTGFLTISPNDYGRLESLFFLIGNTTYEFTPNAQTWPRSLNSVIGGDPDKIYLIVGDLGSPSGEGMDFVNGYVFLERYYHVYDSDKNQVGFAPTQFTYANSN